MPLPDTIPVRYTEEEAGYVTVRPVVRQTFRLDELLDMILSVSGKDAARIRQILHAGTVVYHFFRYSWLGFDADEVELSVVLTRFPDADPSRPFDPDKCTMAIFEAGGPHPRHLLELDRSTGQKRLLFRRKSFWERLGEIARDGKPAYHSYSFGHRADLYRLDLKEENTREIARAAERLAKGKLRYALRILSDASSILFVCPRSASARKQETPQQQNTL
jgi:hypothetical protein